MIEKPRCSGFRARLWAQTSDCVGYGILAGTLQHAAADAYFSWETELLGPWQAHFSDAAADSALHRPGFSAVMAQPLHDLFARRLAAPAAAAARRADPASGPAADPAEEPGGAAPMEYEAPAGYEDMGAPAYEPQPDGGQDAGALVTPICTMLHTA